MIAQGSGVIINNSSGWGIVGGDSAVAYCASKGGVVLLTKAMAIDHGRQGIRVNCICPGGVDTEGMREAFGLRGREQTPPLMQPGEIAALAVFLASDASSAITGTAIDAFGWTNPLFT